MSPLIAAPNRGYADWQRVDNWDTGVLYGVTTPFSNATVTSPVLDMSRHAYMGGAIGAVSGRCLVDITWYADSAASIVVGVRSFVLVDTIPSPSAMRLPNLGPFAVIRVSALAAANYVFSTQVIGTNRVHQLEFIPRQPELIDVQAFVLGGGLNVGNWPTSYYAGPVRMVVTSTLGNVQFQLQLVSAGGASEQGSAVYVPNANVFTEVNLITPPGAWQILANNTGAAQSIYVIVYYPSTGAT